MDYTIITRKIEVYINCDDKDLRKQYYDTIYKWQRLVVRGANYCVSHLFVQENIKDFFYVLENTKIKLANAGKDENGIFDTSRPNTIYRLLSNYFKGELPSAIFSPLSKQIYDVFSKETKDYFKGSKSLKSYRNTLPIPFTKVSIRNFQANTDSRNYCFDLFGLPFATRLGRDRSNNEVILNRILANEYEMCDSSIQVKDNKLFLLLVVKLPKQLVSLDGKKILYAYLSIDKPITYLIEEIAGDIGTKEEFLHRRLQIQNALRRLQINSKYNQGGHGRNHKLTAIDRFNKKEKNYVDTKLHTYSKILIDVAVKYKCGNIILMNQERKEEEAKKEPFVLRNWSYYGLKEKIVYKAGKFGILITEQNIDK